MRWLPVEGWGPMGICMWSLPRLPALCALPETPNVTRTYTHARTRVYTHMRTHTHACALVARRRSGLPTSQPPAPRSTSSSSQHW